MSNRKLSLITVISVLGFTALTTPFSSWHEHIAHFSLLSIFSILLLGFTFKGVLFNKNARIFSFVILLLTVFTFSHVLPCHMLFGDTITSHHANTTEHPCCIPLTATSLSVSVVPQLRIAEQSLPEPQLTLVAPFYTKYDNKSPPATV